MNLLLDTHAFIWWDAQPERLPPRVLGLCEDSANGLVLSVASLWEIQIKSQLGKLRLERSLRTMIEEQQRSSRLALLPVRSSHVLELDSLPPVHRDPFDRILVAQARVEGLRLVSHDAIMRQYDVDVTW